MAAVETSALSSKAIAFLHVLAEVELDDAERDLFFPAAARELLQDLEFDGTLGQVVVLIDADPDMADDLGVVILDLVVGDRALRCAAAVLGVDGVCEVPFYY